MLLESPHWDKEVAIVTKMGMKEIMLESCLKEQRAESQAEFLDGSGQQEKREMGNMPGEQREGNCHGPHPCLKVETDSTSHCAVILR